MNDAPETLDPGAFKHVVVPIGVVIALGVARIVTAASQYIQNRERVRLSWAHTAWSGVLFLWFVGMWWISWGLRHADADRWTYFTLIFLLVGPSLMYLAATLLLPEVPAEGELDLAGRFDEIGRAFFLCLAGFVVWLVGAEMLLLEEPFAVPKRANQSLALALFATGAAFPSRRTASILGLLVLALAVFGLATVRARLL